MRIFQIDFSKLHTSIDVLNWLTSEEIKGGRNCERYWVIRTNVAIQSANNDEAVFNLSVFLDMAQKNNYQSVQIIKNV